MLHDSTLCGQPPMFWTPTQHQFWAELLFFRALERDPSLRRLSTDRAAWVEERVVPKIRLFLSDLSAFDERSCMRYAVGCAKEALRGRS